MTPLNIQSAPPEPYHTILANIYLMVQKAKVRVFKLKTYLALKLPRTATVAVKLP